jgi:hypothetical protein
MGHQRVIVPVSIAVERKLATYRRPMSANAGSDLSRLQTGVTQPHDLHTFHFIESIPRTTR